MFDFLPFWHGSSETWGTLTAHFYWTVLATEGDSAKLLRTHWSPHGAQHGAQQWAVSIASSQRCPHCPHQVNKPSYWQGKLSIYDYFISLEIRPWLYRVHLSDFSETIKVLAEEREGRKTNAQEDSMMGERERERGTDATTCNDMPTGALYWVQEGDSYGMWERLGYPGRTPLSGTPASAPERS